MVYIYLVPSWFINFSIIMEILFAIVAGLVAFYSFKIYELSEQRELKLFGISFSLIAVSYVLLSFLNILITKELAEGLVGGLQLSELSTLQGLGVYFRITLFILGLATLAYTVLKVKDKRVYWIITLLSLVGIFFSNNTAYSFYIIASVFFLFITYHYYKEYLKDEKPLKLLIFIAFLLFFFDSLISILSPHYYLPYVIGHILELSGYLLILIGLIKTIKNV